MGLKKEIKQRFIDAPVVEKGVNITDNEMGNLIDDGKKIRYRDYRKISDLL